MSEYNCYLCASDEGILLDIFGDAGKAFREYIETCLSVKVKRSDVASTKICHKCAYELESCQRFLANCKRFRDSEGESTASKRRVQCRLCGVTPKKLHLLQVNQGNSLKNLFRKLQQVFLEYSLKEDVVTLTICLDCRYNLDVLVDLKIIHREWLTKLKNVKENGLKLLDLPKTRTSVVTRKTTYIRAPKLNGNSCYESDATTSSSSSSDDFNMPLKRKRGIPQKESEGTGTTTSVQFRNCEDCETQVEHGIDMYRYHRSGRTVCRECWLMMDPEKMSNGKRKRLASSDPESGTKLCAVFLKDVLSNPSKYKSIYKVEKDKEGNTTFLITDESSENEEKDNKALPRSSRARAANSTTPTAPDTTTEARKGLKRSSPKESKIEHETVKKGRTRRSEESVETSPGTVKVTRARNGLAVEADSTIKTRSRRGSSELTTTSMRLSPEIGQKSPPAKKTRRAVKNASSKKLSGDEKSHEGESSSNESRVAADKPKTMKDKKKEKTPAPKNRVQKAERRTRSNSFTGSTFPTPDTTLPDDPSSEDSAKPLNARKTKKLSKTSKSRIKNAKSDSELDKPYTCSVCRLGCKNKLVGKSHELTHEKQPEVKLRRVVVSAAVVPPETIVEETPLEVSVAEEEEETKGSRDEETTGAREEETKGSRDEKTEGSQNEETKGSRDEDTKGSRDEDTKGSREEETKGSREEETNGSREEEKEHNAAVDENPEPVDQSTEKSHIDDTSTSEKLVSEEKRETSPVREEPGDERTTEREPEDEKENEEETHLPLDEGDDKTIDQASKPVDKDEPLSQEKEPETNENKENATNENRENDNSEERKSERKEEETDDKVEESSVGTKEPSKVGVEPPMAPTEVESEKPMEETSTEDVEEKTQTEENVQTVEESEPMEVTETQEKEKSVEEIKEPVIEDVEKEEKDNNEMDTKEDDDESPDKTEQETEVDNSTAKSTSETKETPEVVELDDEEKDEDKSSDVKDERAKEPQETIDLSMDEDKERGEEQVSLVVEENKEEEKPKNEQSEKEDEKKEEENAKADEPREVGAPTSESSTVTTECIREVFDLANAEVKKRLESENSKDETSTTAETLENISLEVQNGADMPSLELEAANNDKS